MVVRNFIDCFFHIGQITEQNQKTEKKAGGLDVRALRTRDGSKSGTGSLLRMLYVGKSPIATLTISRNNDSPPLPFYCVFDV